MRADAYNFAALNEADAKSPRFVAAIVYDVDSLYITSHGGIAGVPGTVIEGALSEPTVTSQRLNPDEATAEIGAASFGLVDLGEQFTLEVRERLQDGAGLRGKQVRFYLGYEGLDFGEFVVIGTQIIHGVTYSEGKYRVSCLDIQRALRTNIFELIETTLAASISATDTTITLTSTAGLQRVAHGPSYTDAPNSTVGYIKIKSEIVRYDDIAGNQLIGCVRGIFGTAAAAYTVDPATPPDRRERVTEYVYLELPAIKLAYALLTGQVWGAGTLPTKWHLGVDPALVTDEDFTGIGNDLWNVADDTAGFVVRFEGLKAQDGKRFLEKELFLLTGVYMPVYSDGSLGLRRMVRLSEDAATTLTLDETNSVQVDDLVSDMESLHNIFVVNWSWNGEEFRRATAYFDPESRAVHGDAPTHTLSFKGLYGGRHTDGVVYQMLDLVRDRFAGPPWRLGVKVLHGLNRIEVGDVLRVRYKHVRDFSSRGVTTSIDRAFEVQNISVDHRNGGVALELFASTAVPTVNAPTAPANSLPDDYYTSQGTALASAPGITIVGGHVTAASQPVVGTGDVNAAESTYYYPGDLTIDAGVEVIIAANVQLRVGGFLQINGSIVGKGRGHAGIADDGRALAYPSKLEGEGPVPAETIPGTPGYVGTVRGYDGIRTRASLLGTYAFGTWPPHLTTSQHSVAPRLLLAVSGNVLSGLPTDLRGAGGGPGGRIGNANAPFPVAGRGGTGGNGGAGLVLVTRGMAFGANGFIDLSGDDSAPTTADSVNVQGTTLERYPGAGAGGGPGALYVLLDGSDFSVPDFSGNKFRALAGATPVPDANALESRRQNAWAPSGANVKNPPRVFSPLRGFQDPDFDANNAKNYSGSALVVQYIPSNETATPDPEDLVPPVTSIQTQSAEQAVIVALGLPDFEDFDSVQVYASITDQRADAVKVAEGKFDTARYRAPDGWAGYFWARTKKEGKYSSWYPASPTAGVPGSALGGLMARGGVEVYGNSARKVSGNGAWNADVYSQETYTNGAYFSCQPLAANIELVVGLNSDPESDSSYTSLDYAFNFKADGTLAIYESNALIANVGAYTVNTVVQIRHDGQQVQYFKDGALLRTVTARNLALFFDSSFYSVGSGFQNLKYGPLTPAPGIPWIARGNVVATATTMTKSGGVNAWDSDAYSFEAYRNGAFASAIVDRTDTSLMFGLQAAITGSTSWEPLNYAWYAASDGTLHVAESGGITAVGAYAAGTRLAISYDGKVVRYIKDGVLIRERPDSDRTFQLRASMATPNAALRNVTFTPYGAATPVPFLARGAMRVSDTGAQKVGGSASWDDADFVSINGYVQVFVEFKPSQADCSLMVGLNSDPFTDQSYTSINAAWYCTGSGLLQIYESGGYIGDFGGYSTTTHLAITNDGTWIRYYKDAVNVRTVAAPSPGSLYYADASFNTPGSAINSLRFGPGIMFSLVDTAQLRENAATTQVQSTPADSSVTVPAMNLGSSFFDQFVIASVTISNPSSTPAQCDISYKGMFGHNSVPPSGASYFARMNVSGAAFYGESTTAGIFRHVYPEMFVKAGSVSVTVPAGGSITATLNLAFRYNAGAYAAQPINYRDLALTATMMKR